MGWSCNAAAMRSMNKWIAACQKNNNGSQNTWSTPEGGKYMFETSRTEHDDGAITGSIFQFAPDGIHVRPNGSFRIEGDGTVKRAPKFLKDAAEKS